MISNKSNVAVFSFAYAPFEGGAEIAAREIIKRLDAISFKIFTARLEKSWSARELVDNVEILRLGRGKKRGSLYGRFLSKGLYIWNAWREAERLHQVRRFDAIWSIMASYGGIAALFFKLRHPTIPFLLTIQEGDSESHLKFGKFGLVGFGWKHIIRNADMIQVISTHLKGLVEKSGSRCPIKIIPNGVDRDLWEAKYSHLEIKAIREQLGIKDEYVVITTSRLVYKNGVDTLIKAVANFKKKRPNVKLLIIGGGPERKKMETLRGRLNLDNNVIFLGQVAHRDLPLYFRIADVFARPSRSEGLGSAFLEAMASGVPVVATRIGGIVDFLQEKDAASGFGNGKYVEVDDPESVSRAMLEIIENPNLREALVSNGKKMVREQYDWDLIARMFKNLFDQLINL